MQHQYAANITGCMVVPALC